MTKPLLILLFVVSFSFHLRSQKDTSFWFAAPDISNTMGDFPIVLHFETYALPSIVVVKQPALASGGINATISVPANSIYTLDITPYLPVVEAGPSNSISPNGIYISSKEDISAYYTIGDQAHNNKEMISLKGQRAVGNDFYIPMPSSVTTHTIADGGVGFDVVATEPGVTTLLISTRAATTGHPKNATFVRILNQGETFSVRDDNTENPSALGGSIISADRKIAVTLKGSVRTSGSCTSYFADQMLPSNRLGKDYVIQKGEASLDIAYILAPLNGTSFTVSTTSGNTYWLINAAETYSIVISDPITYIRADKPLYLFHISGYGCKLSGAQLAPVYCAGSYSTAFIRLSPDSLNLRITTRNGFQGSFSLTSNGTNLAVPPGIFTVVPGSNNDLVTARLYLPTNSVAPGSYNELRNTADIFGLSLINGGTLGGSAYAQASDFEIKSYAIANAVPVATICANTQFTLNGVVGGGPVTGQWSILQGYGTLGGGSTQLTNNVYTPSLLDTTNNAQAIPANNRYVKIILNSTGICPIARDTLKLHVKQPPIVSAGSSSVICGNNPTLQLSGLVYGATKQGVWNVAAPGTGTFISGINTFTPQYHLSQGDTALSQLQFVLTSTNNAGCNPESSTVTIAINKPPLVKASPVNPILKCSNNATVSLSGVVSGTTTSTGIWYTTGTGVFLPNNVALSTNYIPSEFDISQGHIWLKLESTNNNLCLPVVDSVEVVFTEPSYANAGADLNSCVNNPSIALQGLISGTVTSTALWSGGSGTFVPSASALTASYIGTPSEVLNGSVTLTLSTTFNGLCNSTSDQVRVNFQNPPFANFSVTAVCQGQITDFKDRSINLAQLGALKSWSWDFGDNSQGSTQLNPSHTYASVGIFTTQLIVKNSFNCADTITKPVTIHALPDVDFSITRACSGSSQRLTFKDQSSIGAPSSIPASGHYWDFGGFGFADSTEASVVFPSEGLYSITHIVTSDKGCQSVVSKTVNVTPRPQAKFVHINNSIPGLGAFVNFKDTSQYAQSWSWDFGNGETSNLKDPATSYQQNGLYVVKLTVTDQFGCPNTFTTEVRISTIVSDIVKLIPNVVTPNDDGKNDFWRLDFIEVFFPEAEIEIYNRWGVKLFRSVGYSNAWDGSYKGDPLPVGAYFYTINLHDKDNTPVIRGTVTLIK